MVVYQTSQPASNIKDESPKPKLAVIGQLTRCQLKSKAAEVGQHWVRSLVKPDVIMQAARRERRRVRRRGEGVSI